LQLQQDNSACIVTRLQSGELRNHGLKASLLKSTNSLLFKGYGAQQPRSAKTWVELHLYAYMACTQTSLLYYLQLHN